MMRTWIRRVRAARGDDSGFTLPELIVSMVIMSFIMGAIGLTMVVVLKNTRSSTERVTAGGSAQTLSLWFPGDVQSARGRGAFTDERPTGCGDDQGSTNVVTVQRSDVLQSPGDLVSYRLKQVGPNEYEMWRVACTGGAWSKRVVVQGIADPATVKVSALLTDEGEPPVLTPATALTPTNVFVELGMSLAVGAGDAVPLAVQGSPRSPGVLVPCQVTSATPLTVQRVNGGRLTEPAAFTVNTAGDCVGLAVNVTPDDGGGGITVNLDGGPTTWTGAAPDVTWSIGLHDVTVTSGGTPAGTFTLDVLAEPCEVNGLEPGDVLRIGLDGKPTAPAGSAYVLTTTTSCNVTGLEIDMGDANVATPAVTRQAAGRFAFTIAHDVGPWLAEQHELRAFQGTTLLGTANITAKISNCAVVGLTRVVLVDTSGVLRNGPTLDVDAGFTRCSTPMNATGTNGMDIDLNPNPSTIPPVPGQWSEFLGPYPFTWTPRTTVTVTVTSEGVAAGPAFPVLVDDCSIVAAPPNRITTKQGRPDNGEALTFRTDNRCSFTPVVRFTDNRGTEWVRTAQPAGGASGLQRDWRVPFPGGVRWNDELITVSVFDDAQPTTNGFVGTFDAQGRPD